MPNWENEIKNAIYEESLEGEERDNFILMMNMLKGGTPQEYITDIESKIKKSETKLNDINVKVKDKQRQLALEYSDEQTKIQNAYIDEIANYSEKAPRMAAAFDAMEKMKKEWDDSIKADKHAGKEVKVGSLDEMYQIIAKEAVEKNCEYDRTSTFEDGLKGYQKVIFTSYYNNKVVFDKMPDKENTLEAINKAKENRQKALQDLGVGGTVPEKLLKQKEDAEKEYNILKENKQTIEDFAKNQYKQMQNVKINGLSNAAKEKGTDLLVQARIDYQTKLNGWQRMWANILPSWLYGNAKYVDKINSYKKTLKEVGFSDDEIKKAAPNKDTKYVYNEETKKYEGLVRFTADDFKEEKEVKHEDTNSLKEEKLDAEGPEIEENNDLFIDNQSNKVRVNFAEKEQNEFSFKPANNEVAKNSNQMKQPSLGKKDNNLNK